jgi:TonB-linked SusC/RagA family outer membrane protein
MRISTLLLILGILQAQATNIYSQKARISLNISETKLYTVLDKIEKESEYFFLYNEKLLDIDRIVSVNAKDELISNVLENLFEGTNVKYTIIDRKIILAPSFLTNNSNGTGFQQQKITGSVTDGTTGEPIIGANIVVEGTTRGVVTDVEGKFTIEITKADAVLIASYLGYNTERVSVNGQSVLAIKLVPDITKLEEIVVVGYGTQSKRNVTGSIQSVNADELKDAPVTTVAQKLQGKLSGVQINQTTGKPGQGMSVRIRGQASLTAGNDPLYVVDGFPIVGDISGMNPNEIESISVLKDASSTSLYGSRAANGVVLVTTKKAKTGKTSIGVNAFYGWQEAPKERRPEMMNGQEFAQFKKESFEDRGIPVPAEFQNPEQYGAGYNWYDAILRVAPIQDYSISLSSSKENFSTSAIAGVFKQDGVIVNSDYTRYSVRLNSDFKISKNVHTGFNVAPTISVGNTPNTDGQFWAGGLLNNALLTWPILPYQSADGSYPMMASLPGISLPFPTPNYVRAAHTIKNETKDVRLLTNAYIQYEPITGLVVKSTINFDYGQNRFTNVVPSTTSNSFAVFLPTTSNAILRSTDYNTWLNENTVTYKKSLGGHNFDVLGGYTVQKFHQELLQNRFTGFPDDRVPTLASATSIDRSGTTNTYNDIQEWSIMSYIGRLNYNYKNRYLISAAVRSDGSSRFGSDNRWGTFPSASIGWIVSEEGFMKNIRPVSLLKLRGSFGVVGNNNIGNYTQYAAVSNSGSSYNAIFNSNVANGSAVTSMKNPNLTWEQTQEYDFGFDLGLLNGRINIGYDYYNRKTKSLLYQVNVAQESGFSTFMGNIGELQFWGHEIAVNTQNMIGSFKWSTDFNIAFTDNKVLALTGITDRIYGDGTITKVGQRIGLFYGMVWDGVYKNQQEFDSSPKALASEVGTIKYKDVNGDGKITYGGDSDDRTVIGDPTPKFTYGITNNFSYKNFDLSVVMSGSYGNDIRNQSEQGLANLDGVFNVYKDVKYRWRSEANPGNGRYGKTTSGTGNERDWASSRFIYSTSFLSIKNITFGYTIPVNKLKYIKSLRIYASAQQLYTFTNYKGMNPEISMGAFGTAANALNLGNDYGGYPVPRTISFGLNLGL